MGTAVIDRGLEEAVRRANRAVYNRKSVEDYDQNPSIFNERQTRRLTAILEDIQRRTAGRTFLDIGCGTGNLLKIARGVFPKAYAVDQAERLLSQVGRRQEGARLAAGAAHLLPFPRDTFDAAGMYALLHHLFDPLPALGEAYRVLRPGGILYTDHDPNRYFGRFYHLLYRLRYRNRHGFGSAEEDLAEYHHVYSGGLDPERLALDLRGLGFSRVEVSYRHSTNEALGGATAAAATLLRTLSRVLPLRSFHTHFMLLAEK